MKPSVQWLRHAVQTVAVLFIVSTAVLSWYTTRPTIGIANLPNAATMSAAKHIQGNTWAAQVFGVEIIDPLAGTESMAAGRTVRRGILAAIAIPVVLTVLLGRVFCSWVCPAGFLFEIADYVRRRFARMGFPARETRLWRGAKFIVLAVGLAMSTFLALPLLGAVYPPALIVRELHAAVFTAMDRQFGVPLSTGSLVLTGSALFLLVTVLVEATLSRRIWCRYLCPGGALYTALGRYRLLRVRRTLSACTDCADCVPVCGMGLNPMRDKTGMECDNCQACISSCPEGALSLGLPKRSGA